MKNPSYRVIDKLALRESLMSALVGNNPESGSDQTSRETVERPKSKTEDTIESRIGKLEVCGGYPRVEEGSGLIDHCEKEDVPNAIRNRLASDFQWQTALRLTHRART